MVIIVTDEGWVQKILRELEGELLEERESLLDHEICIIDKCENEGLEKMAVGEFEDMYGEDAYEAYRHAEEEGRVPEGMEDVLVYEVWEAERMMWEAQKQIKSARVRRLGDLIRAPRSSFRAALRSHLGEIPPRFVVSAR